MGVCDANSGISKLLLCSWNRDTTRNIVQLPANFWKLYLLAYSQHLQMHGGKELSGCGKHESVSSSTCVAVAVRHWQVKIGTVMQHRVPHHICMLLLNRHKISKVWLKWFLPSLSFLRAHPLDRGIAKQNLKWRATQQRKWKQHAFWKNDNFSGASPGPREHEPAKSLFSHFWKRHNWRNWAKLPFSQQTRMTWITIAYSEHTERHKGNRSACRSLPMHVCMQVFYGAYNYSGFVRQVSGF